VDLIDGQKLCELVREKEIGIRIVPVNADRKGERAPVETGSTSVRSYLAA
jgi:hypothetical protein